MNNYNLFYKIIINYLKNNIELHDIKTAQCQVVLVEPKV